MQFDPTTGLAAAVIIIWVAIAQNKTEHEFIWPGVFFWFKSRAFEPVAERSRAPEAGASPRCICRGIGDLEPVCAP